LDDDAHAREQRQQTEQLAQVKGDAGLLPF
jgi:hypothetical protein